MRISISLDSRVPATVPPIPATFGRDNPVHHNDVLANRSKARKLWRMLARKLSK